MKKTLTLAVIALILLLLGSCGKEEKNVVQIGVDFSWQRIDEASQQNPEIKLSGVPRGTRRFYVGLTDLNNDGFPHGGGFADNDGSNIIARGRVKGSYNGPSPPFPSVIHTYEIMVEALDENGKTIGRGKAAKIFNPPE